MSDCPPNFWDRWSRIGDWSRLTPGTQLTVVKLAPDGVEAARYPGEVAATLSDWYVIRAAWTYRTVELDGLSFHAGDELLEWFSPQQPFNAFAISSPDGVFKGWYANVTYPPRVDDGERLRLTWHDLYLDVIGLPDGVYAVRDDDELAASGLRTRSPSLHAAILAARAELVRRFQAGLPPFVTPEQVSLPGKLGANVRGQLSDTSKSSPLGVDPH